MNGYLAGGVHTVKARGFIFFNMTACHIIVFLVLSCLLDS